MKTTVDIPDGLFKQLREKASREKTTLKAIIDAALRGYLSSTKKSRKRFKVSIQSKYAQCRRA